MDNLKFDGRRRAQRFGRLAFFGWAMVLSPGCGGAQQEIAGGSIAGAEPTGRDERDRAETERLTMTHDLEIPDALQPINNFSWVVSDELAAMARPGRTRDLATDAAFLQQAGITTLVSLTEDTLDTAVLNAAGIRSVHLPVKDFTPPTLEQITTFVAVVSQNAKQHTATGVHCTAGIGRSGTMAAAYLVAKGRTADEAIAEVRRLRPGSVETAAQIEAVRRYAETLR